MQWQWGYDLDQYNQRRHHTINASVIPGARGLRPTTQIQLLVLCILCLTIPMAEGSTKRSSSAREIHFDLYHDHFIVVTGSLGQLQNRRMVIDTGTNPTMIDADIARELGLQETETSEANTDVLGAVIHTPRAVLPTFSVGPVHRESMTVAVGDLRWDREQTGVRVDAVIGMDVLDQTNFEIDYASRKIRFGEVRLPRSAVPIAMVNRALTVGASLNGAPVRLMVDTGASGLVLFADELQSSGALPIAARATISNLAGTFQTRQVVLNELRVGKANLGSSSAVVVAKPKDCKFQGILGISATRIKRITFDLTNHLMGLEVERASTEAYGAHSFDSITYPHPIRLTSPLGWHTNYGRD